MNTNTLKKTIDSTRRHAALLYQETVTMQHMNNAQYRGRGPAWKHKDTGLLRALRGRKYPLLLWEINHDPWMTTWTNTPLQQEQKAAQE